MTIIEAIGWLLVDTGVLIVLATLVARDRHINITE